MLWIFKVARWTHDRCTKINKSPTVSNGVGASSFEILTAKFGSVAYCGHPNKLMELHLWRFKPEILQNCLPRRHRITRHSDADISDLGFLFFMLLFFSEKNQNLLDIQEHCIRKLGKIRSELKLLFGVYYWFLKLYTGIIWHSYFPSHGISQQKGSGWSGAKWVKQDMPHWWMPRHSTLDLLANSVSSRPFKSNQWRAESGQRNKRATPRKLP